MAVYRSKKSPYYQYDFQIGGHRFFGTTRRTNRREAEAVERAERDRAKQARVANAGAATSLQLDHVIGRYWKEVGQYHGAENSKNTWRDLERLVDYFGPTKLLTEITDNDVATLVAWRRGHRVVRNKKAKPADCPLISNATVNRSTTEVLKKLFTRARTAWRSRFDAEPNWRAHRLPEGEERVRELVGDEGDRLSDATRADYTPFFAFARASGLRLRECLLQWSEVNWEAREIRKAGKGGKLVGVPITPTIRSILWPLRGHHPKSVFTYKAVRTRGGRVRGARYAITYNGVKSIWKRIRKAAEVEGFRFHDFRHDVGTKLLRETGNLKLVQKALNHSDIKTTTRYAHVLTDEVAATLDKISRKKSRTNVRKVR